MNIHVNVYLMNILSKINASDKTFSVTFDMPIPINKSILEKMDDI